MSYYSVGEFYKEKFGSKVYKIAIDAGCTCPTRDGTKGNKGCIFCSANGSGDFVPSKKLSISEQIKQAKEIIQKKVKKEIKYIAYFQNFTNTYGDEKLLVQKYNEAINCENVCGISIATRPDCISSSILKEIAALCKKTFVTIELGFQTSKEESADYIRRGFSNQEYLEAVKRIHQADSRIHVVTHLIFGLPGENHDDMMNSVKFCLNAKTDGIKFTVLYVLKGTDLEKDYQAGKFDVLEMDEYFALLKSALELIPPKIVIHRLTGDGPKKLLIAPMWTANKKNVLNAINNSIIGIQV
ncbi:MAG: TIGR01212 family radical SAM protein [Treponema bryantii]|nr:TIGR01212 family radical SAM protein [Treponema bryantii]